MQVILSPTDSIADSYRALLPDGSGADFQRILDLKVSDCAILCSKLEYFPKISYIEVDFRCSMATLSLRFSVFLI